MSDYSGRLAPIERRSPMVFVIAGGLLFIFAANTTARTFFGESWPVVQSLIAPTGFFVGALGLLSLYPALLDRTPMTARAGGLIAGITAVYWLVIAVGSIGDVVGSLPPSTDVFPMVVFMGVYVVTILAYLVVGVGSLRAGVRSRIVGVFILGPAVMFLLLLTRAAPTYVIDIGHALFHLGVGVGLWTAGIPSDRTEPAPDSPA